jgi:hypothetical protein
MKERNIRERGVTRAPREKCRKKEGPSENGEEWRNEYIGERSERNPKN